ncbi:MAG: DUF2336 domain-containing protein, partial [Pseudolabrys sp.]|nr:DUF2336 domain-containing protein [Pseudolabrys sp.]
AERLLDDASPLVRGALSEVFASAQNAPPVVVHALAADVPDIAVPVLERSPLLFDADLVDLVATGHPESQAAIASRFLLPRSVAAAIAEVGSAQACLALLENPDAEITPFSLQRIIERFGHLAPIRENLLARGDLPMASRQALLAKLSQTLAGFVASRHWLPQDHAQYAAREACEKATVTLAADTPCEEVGDLVRHLRESDQLTAGLLLRALLCGNVVLFEEALAELADVAIDRVTNYVHDKNISGFRALYIKAGLPDAAYPAFREAIAAMRDGVLLGEQGGTTRLKRRMIEYVLAHCAEEVEGDRESLLTLLRRYAVEAAREEARMFCNDLVAQHPPLGYERLVA